MNKALHYLAIAFAFCFVFSIAAANILLAIMFILWLIEGNYNKKIAILKKDKIFLSLSGLAILLILSTLLSGDISHGFTLGKNNNELTFIIKRFFWLSLLYPIFVTSLDKTIVPKLISAFLIAMFINELISYSVFLHLIDINYWKAKHLLYHSITYYDPSPMHHSFYSLFLAVTIFLLINQFSLQKNLLIKIWILLFLSSSTINLFLNGGRIGQLAFIIGALIYFITYLKEKKYLFLVIALLSTIVITAYKINPIFHDRINYAFSDLNQTFKNQNYQGSWGARIGLNIISWKYLTSSLKNFVFGAGAGVAKKEIYSFAKENYPQIAKGILDKHHLHNQYLQYWVDGSFFALLILLYLLYQIIILPIPHKALQYAIVAIFAISFIADLFLYRTRSYLLFLFLIALFQLQTKEKNAMA